MPRNIENAKGTPLPAHPHDRALIAFGSDVLAILERHRDWSADTTDEIATSARELGLSGLNDLHEFQAIPRSFFKNPLNL